MESSTGVRSGFATSSASARAAAAAAVSRSTSGETMLANELGAAGVEDDTIPATSIAPTPAVYAASSAVGRIGGRAPASDAAAGDATDSDQGHSAGGGRSTPHQPVSIRRHRTRVDRSDTPTSLAVPSAVQVALESGDEDDSDDGDGGVDDMGRVEGVGGFLRPSRSNSDWSAGAKGVSLDLEVAGVSPVPGHSASHGKGSRWNLKRSSTSFAWDRTFAVDESGAAGSAEGRRSPAGRVASSRAAQRQLLSALDPSAEEVKRSNTVSVGGYTVFTRSKRIRSFNVVRQTYKTQMEARRKNVGHSDALLAFLLVLIDVRVYYDLLLRLLMSTSRVVLFMILDVISDCLFCVLYVVDLQWAVAHDGDDAFQTLDLPHRWLWINRRVETFDIALAFSVFNLLSLLCRVALDDSKLKTIFSVTTFIDVITSLPFVVASGFRVGQYIYLPFFLRGAIIVSRFKQVLRLRGATSLLNFDAVKEKVVILLVTMLSIIYVGTCAFQFTEFRFGSNAANNDFYQCIYFIVVTLSTVGYGDVTASSQYGRVVTIIIILVTISILPNLISSLAASISSQSSNGGSYKVGRTPFVVVMGEFDTVPKLLDVMETFLDEEQGDQAVTLVFLARNPPTPGVKNLVQQSLYRGRVHFLVGSGTEADDFERAQIRHASAVYLIADRGASDAEIEDERNTFFAPQTPLYISNLRPDAESFQESTATAVICVEDLKQFILGLTTLYSGAANLLINLLHKYAPPSSFDEAWMAQYGDGLGNELYSRASNPAFAGRPFSELAWYLFREFQVILIGVKAQVEEYDEGVHLLNPGPSYLIKEGDTLLLIAQSPAEVNSIASLSKEEFLASVKMERDEFYYDYGTIRTSPRPSKHENSLSRQRPPAATPSTAAAPTPTTTPLTHVTQPNVSFLDSRVPLCHVLDRRARAEDVVVRTAAHFSDHVLVCTASLDVFKFVATLR
ncbi:potassium channel, sub T, member 1 [Cladochytrium tenue]|nr:potassium channel, sub T, member 1 [Cladochytrium tenue]